MARRQRKAIRKDEYLAAALSLLLPYEERTALRRAKVPAKAVLAMFSPHHIQHHALNADEPWVDEWHNLHPILRDEHEARFAKDAKAIAKVKRLQKRPVGAIVGLGAIQQRAAKKNAPTKLKSPWRGKQRISSRPFPKAHRPMRSRPWPSPSP